MLEGTRYRITTTDDERARVVDMVIFSNAEGKASRREISISINGTPKPLTSRRLLARLN